MKPSNTQNLQWKQKEVKKYEIVDDTFGWNVFVRQSHISCYSANSVGAYRTLFITLKLVLMIMMHLYLNCVATSGFDSRWHSALCW